MTTAVAILNGVKQHCLYATERHRVVGMHGLYNSKGFTKAYSIS